MTDRAPDPRWSLATDALARHKRHPKVNRCDECVGRWPCDTYEMADSHETLLAAAEALVADAESWAMIYTNPNVPQTAEEYVDIRMAVVDQLRAAIRKARGADDRAPAADE